MVHLHPSRWRWRRGVAHGGRLRCDRGTSWASRAGLPGELPGPRRARRAVTSQGRQRCREENFDRLFHRAQRTSPRILPASGGPSLRRGGTPGRGVPGCLATTGRRSLGSGCDTVALRRRPTRPGQPPTRHAASRRPGHEDTLQPRPTPSPRCGHRRRRRSVRDARTARSWCTTGDRPGDHHAPGLGRLVRLRHLGRRRRHTREREGSPTPSSGTPSSPAGRA
jgi:hypothetical protein